MKVTRRSFRWLTSLIEVSFRPISELDRPYVVDLIASCGEETRRLFCPIDNFYAGGGAGYFIPFKAKGGVVYVAEVADAIAGLGYLYQEQQGFGEDIACFGALVADPFQRRGIGTKLMAFLEGEARKKGYLFLWTSGGTNRLGPLRRILDRRGYVVIGELIGGNIMMEKKLV